MLSLVLSGNPSMVDSRHVVSYRAKYLFPVDASPLENAYLNVCGNRIASVSKKPEAIKPKELGNVALIPGLINAHTHLEFSSLSQPIEPIHPFANWIENVVAYRRTTKIPRSESIAQGIKEAISTGTTCVGEIATFGWDVNCFDASKLHAPPFDATIFFELLGLRANQIETQIQAARDHLALAAKTSHWKAGLSPHAPYSVHWNLFTKVVELARTKQIPLAFHLAETAEELELLQHGSGPIRELLERFEVWEENAIPTSACPMNYLEALATLSHVLLIHGNFLSEKEIDFVAKHSDQMTVVYCPRTHQYFQHQTHPLEVLLKKGASVAVGTDSRASNPDLDLWRELQTIRQIHPNLSPKTILQLGTINAAKGLNRESEIGTLSIGKLANVAMIALDEGNLGKTHDPHEVLFAAETSVKNVMIQGEWIKPQK